MYYIDDYRKRAIDKIIPYLIEFPQIVKIIENSADRYQAIEDVLWKIAENFRVIDSRGVFLKANANNEVVDLIYTDKAEDAFTYGTDKPLYQAYGTGHYYSQTSYISGIKKTVSEDKLIRAVQAKIIQNNTNGTIEDIIQALKLMYNAEHVKLLESNPLQLSIMLSGLELELSSSGNYENIKKMIPACVALKNLYVDPKKYDLFLYDEKSSYGDSRYPILVGTTTDKYAYKSHAINLTSKDKEMVILNHIGTEKDSFFCFCGEFSQLNDGATLFSLNESDTVGVNFQVIESSGKKFVGINYNGQLINSNFEVELNRRYTFLLSNSNNKLGLWCYPDIILKGRLSEDSSYLARAILVTEPNIKVENFTSPNAPIYINCKDLNGTKSNYGNFTYYSSIFGHIEGDSAILTEYYVTCYGEKQIVFNCIENKNHLYVYTDNPLVKNITVDQPYFNYRDTHGTGKYLYFDGKSGLDYNISPSDIDCVIDEFELNFKVCQPVESKKSIVIDNLLNLTNEENSLNILEDGRLMLKLVTTSSTGGKKEAFIYSDSGLADVGDMPYIKTIYKNKTITYYINDVFAGDFVIEDEIHGIPKTVKLGYNNSSTEFFRGFISNFTLNIKAHKGKQIYDINLDTPLQYRLYDTNKKYEYVNKGARFITVPQLIDNKDNKDLYGYNTLWSRN